MASETLNCPAYKAIQLLQEKWTLHIVSTLLVGPRGFNELGREVGGCNPSTLAQRLDRLEALGLVAKTVHSTMPPRTSYVLTEAGVALEGVIHAIHDWASQHLNVADTSEDTSADTLADTSADTSAGASVPELGTTT